MGTVTGKRLLWNDAASAEISATLSRHYVLTLPEAERRIDQAILFVGVAAKNSWCSMHASPEVTKGWRTFALHPIYDGFLRRMGYRIAFAETPDGGGRTIGSADRVLLVADTAQKMRNNGCVVDDELWLVPAAVSPRACSRCDHECSGYCITCDTCRAVKR